MIFFEFEPSFIQWLIRYAGNKPIIDVGCGEGHLVRALIAAKFTRAHGIDIQNIQERDMAPHVIVADATALPLLRNRGLLLVMARPCHGQWIETIINQADCGSEVLYIGRESHVETDLGDEIMPRAKLLEDVPGMLPRLHEEGGIEPIRCWSIPPKYTMTVEYWLVNDGYGAGTRWTMRNNILGPRGRTWTEQDEGLGYWVNGMGGGCRVSEKDKILEGPITIYEERELDYTKTTAVQDAMELSKEWFYPEGWLSPEGVFHACERMKHDWFAYYCLGYNVRELEELGWARVRNDESMDGIWTHRSDEKNHTMAQRETLKKVRIKFNQPETAKWDS